eukprot:CAMPEP_0117573716 /NCGR_PEP_ID=MMETSP0784-20121206/61129_1 /TAXON_ID=39447 /ORGANISM="" /LENGTH=340 /DNA_ID=CAMNT_0005372353 /DNA_START=124 /DNA_END=1144 /DNA_ORIENTATION=-
MPYVFGHCGIVWALALIGLMMIAMFLTVVLLGHLTHATGSNNYGDIVGSLIGGRAQVAAEIAIAVFGVSTCSAFLVVVADSFTPTLQMLLALVSVHADVLTAWRMAVVLGGLMVLPFAFKSKLGHLDVLAMLGVALVSLIVIDVVYKFFTWDRTPPPGGPIRMRVSATHLLPMISTIAFSYQCHIQSPRIYREMKRDDSEQSWWAVVATGYAVCTVMYVVAGLLGYLMFGNQVSPDIADHLGPSVQSVVGFQAIVGYVINHFPARESIYEIQHKASFMPSRGPLLGDRQIGAPRNRDGRMPRCAAYSLAVFIVLVAVGLAFILKDLQFATAVTEAQLGLW